MNTNSTGTWRTSSYTHKNGACVEVRDGTPVGVRDTKWRSGPQLAVDPAAWKGLIRKVK